VIENFGTPKTPLKHFVKESPYRGNAPLEKYQFKPGKEWKGNRLGRPKILYEESAAALREIDPVTGKTKARLMVDAMIETAQFCLPHSVAAFKALCELDEQTDREEKGIEIDLIKLVVNGGNEAG